MSLPDICLRPVLKGEEEHFQFLMSSHHYLGSLPKIGECLWYIATTGNEWVALLSFSSPALKCGVRDNWIGWNFRYQYDRLHLIANNSRFLILPSWHQPNLASHILSLCRRRISIDWISLFGHPLLLLETFVDPSRFHGTIYKASNWFFLGHSKGYRRTRSGYSKSKKSPKMVFIQPLHSNVQNLLTQPILDKPLCKGKTKMMLTAKQMWSLPDFFEEITDPRRPHGIRHSIPTVLSIATGAILCGARGYKAISDWAESLGEKARERFICRREKGKRVVPSEYVIRDVLIRVDPAELDAALQKWNKVYGEDDETLAIDGKTMKNALDESGYQTHIMSAVGHQTKTCYTQKKSENFLSQEVIS